MTASTANGFAHVLYTPTATTCRSAPYAFHAEYSTANPRGNTWSAHTYNVAYLGRDRPLRALHHRGRGLQLRRRRLGRPGRPRRGRRQQLLRAGNGRPGGAHQRLLLGRPRLRRALVPERLARHESQSEGRPEASSRAAAVHEPDHRPRRQLPEDRLRGRPAALRAPARATGPPARLRQPAPGAQFYPFYTTTIDHGTCTWQEGGNFIPGTVNHYGGSSTAEFGRLLRTVYPAAGFTTATFINNFNSGDEGNPCSATP